MQVNVAKEQQAMWKCECGGRRRIYGRLNGKLDLICTSCAEMIQFDSLDACVKQEEQLALHAQPALQLIGTDNEDSCVAR